MAFTPADVSDAESQAVPYKLSDRLGLYLEVGPSAAKPWKLKYRFKGYEPKLALGDYPTVSLSLAWEKRDIARASLKAGHKPGAEERLRV